MLAGSPAERYALQAAAEIECWLASGLAPSAGKVRFLKHAPPSNRTGHQNRRGRVIALSLIGMSGAGKSFWAQKLAAAGFRPDSIDDRIEEKLAPELAAGGYRGIGGVAAWMGWPNQPSYLAREQKYLHAETDSMREALSKLERPATEGIVLDTTGSVVYTGEDIGRRLRRLTVVVYLEAAAPEEET